MFWHESKTWKKAQCASWAWFKYQFSALSCFNSESEYTCISSRGKCESKQTHMSKCPTQKCSQCLAKAFKASLRINSACVVKEQVLLSSLGQYGCGQTQFLKEKRWLERKFLLNSIVCSNKDDTCVHIFTLKTHQSELI